MLSRLFSNEKLSSRCVRAFRRELASWGLLVSGGPLIGAIRLSVGKLKVMSEFTGQKNDIFHVRPLVVVFHETRMHNVPQLLRVVLRNTLIFSFDNLQKQLRLSFSIERML